MGVLVLQLDGALSNGQEQQFPLNLTGAITVERISGAVRTAPGGGALTFRLQKQTGASPTDYIQATISSGQLIGLVAAGAIANVTSDLFLRIVTANGAQSLTVTAETVEAVAGRSLLSFNLDGAPGVGVEWARVPGPSLATDILALGVMAKTPPSPSSQALILRILDSSGAIVDSVSINVSPSGFGSFGWPIGAPPLRLPGGSTLSIFASSVFVSGMSGAVFVLELGTPDTGDDLCSVDDVRTLLGIDTPDQDGAIQLAVTAASEMLRSYTLRRLTELAFVTAERIDPRGLSLAELRLREYPVISVSNLTDDDGNVVSPSSYAVDQAAGIVRGVGGYVFTEPVLVDYTIGYADGLPLDLRYAAMLQAGHLYQQAAGGGGRLGNRGPAQAEAGSPGYVIGPWQPDARDIADRYRRFE